MSSIVRRFRPHVYRLGLLVFLAASTIANATSVATDPVGFITVNAYGGVHPPSLFVTTAGLGMSQLPVYQSFIPAGGVSTTVDGVTKLTFPKDTFALNQFNGTGNAYYLQITNGSGQGAMSLITSTKNNVNGSFLFLADDISAAITAGSSTFKIVPCWTFATAFGAKNSAGFQPGTGPADADSIGLVDPVTNVKTPYYYDIVQDRWQTGSTDATNTVIPPDAGLFIKRRPQSTLQIKIAGAVNTGPTAFWIEGSSSTFNVNQLPNPYPVKTLTLATLGLYTGNTATGVAGAATSAGADFVKIYDGTGTKPIQYYYNTTDSKWEVVGTNADASDIKFRVGASLIVKRMANHGSFVWYMPQPPMQLQ